MDKIKTIAGINLLLMLIYYISTYSQKNGEKIILYAFAIALHMAINFTVAIVYFSIGNANMAKAWLLSGGIVLVIGFSTCLGTATL